MKITKFILMACVALFISLNIAFAQGKDKKNSGDARAKIYTEQLTKFLALNGEQAKKILAINAEINKKIDSKTGNAKNLRADRKQRIVAVLNATQKTKFEKQFEQAKNNKGKGKSKKDDDDDDESVFGK